jgi:4-hydroxy-tetrahydrodipicolinate synthase
MQTHLISALCTPIRDDETLDVAALAVHLDDQWRNGIAGVLIGGSMGLMQLLEDEVYRDLVQYGVSMSQGHGEIMVGAGDASFTRTLRRIRFVEQFNVDGIVVLSPYFETFEQGDLVAYFRALANESKKPLYLYDLPGITRTRLELNTVLQLSKHPNIRGIKCSGDWQSVWRLMSSVDDGFRVIPAQPTMIDLLVRGGVRDNLDGIFGVVPDMAVGIAAAAEAADYEQAAAEQCRLSELLQVITTKYPLLPACSAILQARGVPARIHPIPMESLSAEQVEQLFNEPALRPVASLSEGPETIGSASTSPVTCVETGVPQDSRIVLGRPLQPARPSSAVPPPPHCRGTHPGSDGHVATTAGAGTHGQRSRLDIPGDGTNPS